MLHQQITEAHISIAKEILSSNTAPTFITGILPGIGWVASNFIEYPLSTKAFPTQLKVLIHSNQFLCALPQCSQRLRGVLHYSSLTSCRLQTFFRAEVSWIILFITGDPQGSVLDPLKWECRLNTHTQRKIFIMSLLFLCFSFDESHSRTVYLFFFRLIMGYIQYNRKLKRKLNSNSGFVDRLLSVCF